MGKAPTLNSWRENCSSWACRIAFSSDNHMPKWHIWGRPVLNPCSTKPLIRGQQVESYFKCLWNAKTSRIWAVKVLKFWLNALSCHCLSKSLLVNHLYNWIQMSLFSTKILFLFVPHCPVRKYFWSGPYRNTFLTGFFSKTSEVTQFSLVSVSLWSPDFQTLSDPISCWLHCWPLLLVTFFLSKWQLLWLNGF